MAKKKKIRVGLIFGGKSEERKVSLVTGKTVAYNLNPERYEIVPIEISREGKWLLESETIKQISNEIKTQHIASTKDIVPVDLGSTSKIDVAFLALHGPGGEDGTIQGMLDVMGIPYTFSGTLASALAMDKHRTNVFLSGIGIPVIKSYLITKKKYTKEKRKLLNIKTIVVVKPNKMGSSLGVEIAKGKRQIEKAIKNAFKYDSEIIIEDYIKGRELSVPVLGNSEAKVLPVVEIIPLKNKFFDYASKYEEGGAEEIVPARIPDSKTREINEYALKIHYALGCRGVSRSDFILGDNNKLYFLEVNTIPGMTPTSLVPKSAKAAGISFKSLLDKLIELSLVT
jgi:D-alanine-D-alanine ligase